MDNQKDVLVISHSNFERDGRLKELVKIGQLLGRVSLISQSTDGQKKQNNHYVINGKRNRSYLYFILFSLQVARRLQKDCIVFADNRKSILPAILIRAIHPRVLLIHDSRELYIMKDVKHLSGKIGCVIEYVFLKKFDLILCANKERARIMKYVHKLKELPIVFENIRKLENTIHKDLVETHNKYNFLRTEKRLKVISTSGFAFERGGDELINALSFFSEEMVLYIFGSATKLDIEKFHRIQGNDNITNIVYIGTVNLNELQFCIQNCDIGAVFYHKKDLNNKYCASGKVYEFIFEGIPIVCSDNIPLVTFCNTYKVGVADSSFATSLKKMADNYEYYRNNAIKTAESINIEEYRDQIAKEIRNRILTR